MVSSSFQTENLGGWVSGRQGHGRGDEGDILLDVLGQTRHEVVAVLVQRLALCLVLVERVHNGALERLGRVARGVLRASQRAAPWACGRRRRGQRTRMLGVSVFSPAISFARRAVVEKAR